MTLRQIAIVSINKGFCFCLGRKVRHRVIVLVADAPLAIAPGPAFNVLVVILPKRFGHTLLLLLKPARTMP